MDEGRRFLRVYQPGLTSITECLLLMWLVIPDDVLKSCSWEVDTLVKGAGLVVVVAGALGVLLSVLHHALVGCPLYARLLAPDHRATVAELAKANRLPRVAEPSVPSEPGGDAAVPEAGTKPATRAKLSQNDAWVVLNAWWHGSQGKADERSVGMAGASGRAASLADIAHGVSASLVGCLLALLAAYVSLRFLKPPTISYTMAEPGAPSVSFAYRSCVATSWEPFRYCAIGFLLLHAAAARRTVRQAETYVDQVAAQVEGVSARPISGTGWAYGLFILLGVAMTAAGLFFRLCSPPQ